MKLSTQLFRGLMLTLVAAFSTHATSMSAFAQDSKTQQLIGSYLGLADFGVGTAPFAVQLEIDQQDTRTFLGNALLPYLEQDNIAVKGTIAASGNCTIQADSNDGRSTLQLDWLKAGGGAAGLTGEASLMGDGSVKITGPVALLRPFADLGVDWGDGNAQAEFFSHTGGVNFGIAVDFLAGPTGLFAASFSLGREEFEILGTSNTDQQVFAVGVSGSKIITLIGKVQLDERGEPVAVDAEYVIESASGKIIDTGIIAILIG